MYCPQLFGQMIGGIIMGKFSIQEKLKIYDLAKAGCSKRTLAKDYGINCADLKYLIRLIDAHGPEILKRTSQKYSTDFKTKLIKESEFGEMSVRDIAVKYGLATPSILRNWRREYYENNCVIVEKKRGRPSAMTKPQETKPYDEMTVEEKIAYLEKKTEYLEAENEYLKKVSAVVQERKNQRPKKR